MTYGIQRKPKSLLSLWCFYEVIKPKIIHSHYILNFFQFLQILQYAFLSPIIIYAAVSLKVSKLITARISSQRRDGLVTVMTFHMSRVLLSDRAYNDPKEINTTESC